MRARSAEGERHPRHRRKKSIADATAIRCYYDAQQGKTGSRARDGERFNACYFNEMKLYLKPT